MKRTKCNCIECRLRHRHPLFDDLIFLGIVVAFTLAAVAVTR